MKLANEEWRVLLGGMKAMTTFSHCWKKEVFLQPLVQG